MAISAVSGDSNHFRRRIHCTKDYELFARITASTGSTLAAGFLDEP
jgi:hypothetical protein